MGTRVDRDTQETADQIEQVRTEESQNEHHLRHLQRRDDDGQVQRCVAPAKVPGARTVQDQEELQPPAALPTDGHAPRRAERGLVCHGGLLAGHEAEAIGQRMVGVHERLRRLVHGPERQRRRHKLAIPTRHRVQTAENPLHQPGVAKVRLRRKAPHCLGPVERHVIAAKSQPQVQTSHPRVEARLGGLRSLTRCRPGASPQA